MENLTLLFIIILLCKKDMKKPPGGEAMNYFVRSPSSDVNSVFDICLNLSTNSATVRFFFSSPEMSRMIWPSCIMISLLP